MKLQFLGVGAAIKTRHHGASALINDHLLVDAPPAVHVLLRREGLRIDAVFLTHLHGDHFCGLPFWLLEKYVEDRHREVHVYGPRGTKARIEAYFEVVFPDLDLSIVPIFESIRFFEVEPAKPIECMSMRITPVEGRHAVPSVGYLIEDKNTRVYFSGDTELFEPVLRAIDAAEHLVVEATKKTGVLATHMTLEELMPVIRRYPQKDFYMTHRQDYLTHDINEQNVHFPEEGDIFYL